VIPEDWVTLKLWNIADKISVGIASAATHAYQDRGVCLLRNQNIRAEGLDDSDVLYISKEYEKAFINKRLKAGDLITARTGYPGTTCIVPNKYEGSQSFTTLITRLKSSCVSTEFINFVINSKIGQSYFEKAQIGGGQKNVNAASLRLLTLPLPSTLAEQEAIAGALSDADGLIESLEQLIEKKRQIKQGAMQQLLSPWEPESQSPETNPAPTSTTPNPPSKKLKQGWVEKTLGEMGTFKNGLNKDKNSFGHGSPFVNLMDVFGAASISSGKKLGLIASNKEEQTTYDLRKGDVLFIRSSVKPSGVGLTSVIAVDLPSVVYSGFLIRYRCEQLHENYSKYCFYESTFRANLIAASSVSANTNINQTSLALLKITIPSKQEQIYIAKIVSDMDTEIATLETKLSKAKQIKQGMMQELLTGKTRLI